MTQRALYTVMKQSRLAPERGDVYRLWALEWGWQNHHREVVDKGCMVQKVKGEALRRPQLRAKIIRSATKTEYVVRAAS